jgi:NTP pyrophosphatase (non-canonical NTP hydrolase)
MKMGELLLQCFQEEAAEVIQEASKCNRFTMNHCQPGTPNISNLDRLKKEFRELLTMASLLEEFFDFQFDRSFDPKREKQFYDYALITEGLGILKSCQQCR